MLWHAVPCAILRLPPWGDAAALLGLLLIADYLVIFIIHLISCTTYRKSKRGYITHFT
jgi:hypothetical protein